MREWPPITDPELVARLGLDDEEFLAALKEALAAWPRREYDPVFFERARGYPFARPPGSYILRGETHRLLRDLGPVERESTIADFTANRHPILAFGANAAPERLAIKFGHFDDDADREVLVLTGDLHGLDVGAVPTAPMIGYIPASLFASPGTAVRAALVWVTAAQATQLAWTEATYRFGRLEDARFEVDEAEIEVEDLFAFVSRLGALCIDGAPVALAAVPARGRTSAAHTQVELLDFVAERVLGPGAGADDLARASCEDMLAVVTRAAETVWPLGLPLASRWTPFPGGG
jgi:hypothetical protein